MDKEVINVNDPKEIKDWIRDVLKNQGDVVWGPDGIGLDEFIKSTLPDGKWPNFKPYFYYHTELDTLECFWENAQDYGDWLNPWLTLMRAVDDNRIVGCKIGGIRQLMDKTNVI